MWCELYSTVKETNNILHVSLGFKSTLPKVPCARTNTFLQMTLTSEPNERMAGVVGGGERSLHVD